MKKKRKKLLIVTQSWNTHPHNWTASEFDFQNWVIVKPASDDYIQKGLNPVCNL